MLYLKKQENAKKSALIFVYMLKKSYYYYKQKRIRTLFICSSPCSSLFPFMHQREQPYTLTLPSLSIPRARKGQSVKNNAICMVLNRWRTNHKIEQIGEAQFRKL